MERTGKLPPGFKAVKDSGVMVDLTPEELPWLSEGVNVRLAEAELENGKKILLGSAVRGQLKKIADRLLSHEHEGGDNVNGSFYAEIGRLVLGGNVNAPRYSNGWG